MNSYTFDMEEYPHLEINGIDFEIKMTDIEIITMLNIIKRKCEGITEKSDAEKVMKAIEMIVRSVDEILGDGAVDAIANGKPVSISTAIRLLNFVGEKAVEAYADHISERYE